MTAYLSTPGEIAMAPDSNEQFPAAIQAVRDGFATLNANIGDLGELVATPGNSGYTLAPEVLGQIMMDHLGIDPAERLSTEAKAYWMQVGAHMGPDWIASLRKVAAYMEKVESF